MLFRWFVALDCPTVPVFPSDNPSPTYWLFHTPEFRPWTASRFDALAGRPTRDGPLPQPMACATLAGSARIFGVTAYPAHAGRSTSHTASKLSAYEKQIDVILGHHITPCHSPAGPAVTHNALLLTFRNCPIWMRPLFVVVFFSNPFANLRYPRGVLGIMLNV